MNKQPTQLPERVVSSTEVARKTALSLATLVILFFAGWKVFNAVKNEPKQAGASPTLRKVMQGNEKIFSGYFDSGRKVKEYPLSAAAVNVRKNGDVGMNGTLDTATWRLKIVRATGDTLSVSLNDVMKLPRREIVFDFKCIEGWSQVTHWGGVRFRDFIKAYHLDNEAALKYVGLETPDKQYYVGIDMPSAMQEQTILCYEMNGKPLPADQGYPLRLIIPVKYGIKHLKRIGTMYFSDAKPKDYWAERGYDYYSGH